MTAIEQLKGKTLEINTNSRFQLGKTQKAIREALASRGISNLVSSSGDYMLLGRYNDCIHFLDERHKLIFERELMERSPISHTYFEGLEQKLYDMVRHLGAMENVRLDLFSIGEGLTETEFEAIEKKLKFPIPRAIREFYSIFGHVQLLWHFKNPPHEGSIYTGSLYIHSGQHQGCINILPLRKFLFNNWKDPELYLELPEDKDVRLFDLYSDYHIVGCDVSDSPDPQVYLGSDHGVDFAPLKGLTFSEYIKKEIGIFGFLNRFTNTSRWIKGGNGYIFDQPYVEDIKDLENIEKAGKGFVDLDTSNQEEVLDYVERTKERIAELKDEGDHKRLYDFLRRSYLWRYDQSAFAEVRELVDRLLSGEDEDKYDDVLDLLGMSQYWDHDVSIFSTILDIQTITDNAERYFVYLKRAILQGFDLSAYERSTRHRKFVGTAEYEMAKSEAKEQE